MDPNETLARIRKLVDRLSQGEVTADGWVSDGIELVGLVDALDGWLSSGGFQPAAWSFIRK